MSDTRHGTMPTDRPARYAKQLGGHWASKGTVEQSDAITVITFDSGQVVTMTPQADRLDVTVTVPEGGDADRFAEVVAAHLERFGQRDELHVDWESAPQ